MAVLQSEVGVLDAPRVETLRAADGQAMTLLFHRLTVSVDGEYTPLATRSASFRIPVSANAEGTDLCLLLRGVATLAPGGRGLLLVHQGGDRLLMTLPEAPCQEADFQERFYTHLGPGEDCRLTVFLLVERSARSADHSLSLALESMDLSVVPTGSRPGAKSAEDEAPRPWMPPPVAWPLMGP